MLSLILTGLAVVAAVSGQDCEHTSCNTGLIKYYKELNCLPVQESGACCPSRFDCTAALANRVPNKCNLKGHSYDQGIKLSGEQTGDNCVAECRCLKDGNGANFQCVHSECPEEFDGPSAPGCTRLYAADRCCSVGEHCTNATKPTAKDVFTCQHAGTSYVVGEKFWPEEKPCHSCICQEGYDGTLNGPWCTEISCGIEINYGDHIKEGCVPVFYGSNGCCPIDWRCPNAKDSVVKNSAAAKDAPQCTFGKLLLKVSEKLNSENECVECTCSLPPHVSCVQEGDC